MLTYNPDTGRFFRNGRAVNPSKRVRFGADMVLAHRLAWYLHHGEWPTGQIDHINRNPSDNRMCNLRECTQQFNQFNTGKHCDNTSGEKNVQFDKGHRKWQVRVKAGALLIAKDASHKISAIVAARLIRRTLHGQFTCNA